MTMTDKLIEIARYLNMEGAVQTLEGIQRREGQTDAAMILPLVGEFSSGKTTLINALTDSKALETANEPTTAVIYEIHFGQDRCHAEVIDAAGVKHEVENIADLKNSALTDAKVVIVYDTSTRVSSSLVLVDTPGLSSPDPRHRQALVDFLPLADGVLLVADINQQVTQSLTKFVHSMRLSKKPAYLVLTKSDSKATSDVENAKRYVRENTEMEVKEVVAVSAQDGALDELLSLLTNLQTQKAQILKEVDTQRTKDVAQQMTARINELLQASTSSGEIDVAIRRAEAKLNRLVHNIDKATDELRSDISDLARRVSRQFEDEADNRLMTIANAGGADVDNQCVAAINTLSSMKEAEFKQGITQLFADRASALHGSDDEIPMDCLQSINLSNYNVDGLSYNLNLSEKGHEYDTYIKWGVYGVTAVAALAAAPAVVGTAAAEGATVAGGAATAAKKAIDFGKVIDVADTVSDVSSMVSNRKTRKALEMARVAVNAAQAAPEKGLVDSFIGKIGDKTWAKPKRKKAVREYIDGTLAPQVKSRLQAISDNLTTAIRQVLTAEAQNSIMEQRTALDKMKQEQETQKAEYAKRVKLLKDYKKELLTL